MLLVAIQPFLVQVEHSGRHAEGLRRGGFLVSVEVDDASYETAHDILDDEGSIDIDEGADTWRKEDRNAHGSNEALANTSYERGIDRRHRSNDCGSRARYGNRSDVRCRTEHP